MIAITKTDLAAISGCSAFLSQLASTRNVSDSTLIAQVKAAANAARDYVFDGPSSNLALDEIKFPGIAGPGITTVKEWFDHFHGKLRQGDGLSQFNGYAVFFRLDDWESWIAGWFSKFTKSDGRINSYGTGTAMHEILHKQVISGGFIHDNIRDTPAYQANIPALTVGRNDVSDMIGVLCFPSLR